MTQLKHQNVVSNFMFKTDHGASQIALFRRSELVRPYQEELSPISGIFDDDERPFDAAVREIRGTGLCLHKDYELHLCGKPFDIMDGDRCYTIHPFSWNLRADNWGNAELCWNSPAEILKGVDVLNDSLRRVWLSDSAIFEDWQDGSNAIMLLRRALRALKEDYNSGASYMAGLALRHFQQIIASFPPHTTYERYWWQIQMIAWHIINNGRPSMNAAITRALLSALDQIKGHDRSRIVSELETCLIDRATMSSKITSGFVTYLQRLVERGNRRISILTLSASITKTAILAVLQQIPDIEIDLRIMESRPLCEGAQMAANLLQRISKSEEARLQVTIATDASVAILAQGVDLVLLGADRISGDGDVSNKTGSFAAALCARAVGNKSPDSITPKVVILAGIEKIAKRGRLDEHAAEDNSSSQVWRVWEMAGCKSEVDLLQSNKRVVFRNVFFEWVPAEYIDSYITEGGEFTREQIQQESVHIEELESRLFDF